MKEIEKKDTPDVSGGYRDGCIPIPVGPYPSDPTEPGGYPRAPISPWAGPDIFVTDPPAICTTPEQA